MQGEKPAKKNLPFRVLFIGWCFYLSISAFVEETLSHEGIGVLNLEQHIGTFMSMNIDISVVDAIRGGEFHPQGGDVAGTITHKLDLVIQPTAFIHIGARNSAAGCQ